MFKSIAKMLSRCIPVSAMLIASCTGSLLTQKSESESTHLDVIAEDLVETASQWVGGRHGVHIDNTDELGRSFERSFRRRGFAIAPYRDARVVNVRLDVAPLKNGRELQVGLIVDDDWRIDRLYRVDEDRIDALSAYTVRAAAVSQPSNELSAKHWILASRDSDRTIDESVVETEDSSFHHEEPGLDNEDAIEKADASEPVAVGENEVAIDPDADPVPVVTVERCSEFNLEVGSLQANLTRIVAACGWRIDEWAVDPADTRKHVDWVIDTRVETDAQSLFEFLDALRTRYGLEFTRNSSRRSLNFAYTTK